MSSSDEYKRQIMKDLAGGNVESLDSSATNPSTEYANFDDFANRSSHDERRQLFGKAFNHSRIPPTEMEPDLRQAISRIKPNERDDVAKEFIQQLGKRGLSDRDLQSNLGLSHRHANHMSEEDVAKLATFTYHNHPDVFQEVLADQPVILKFLSNPLVGAALGAIASKWMGHR